MATKRLRVFAGPNGSGKTTLFEGFSKRYSVGVFLNADFIENALQSKGYLDLNDFHIEASADDLHKFLQTEAALSLAHKSENDGHPIEFHIDRNVIVDKKKETHSYEGALISMFLRSIIKKRGLDFSYETVMSHPSKIVEIEEAKLQGYKTYLYFVCIDDPEINISRVENRVVKGGHAVDSEKTRSRYYRTLNNLTHAITVVDKAYLFDNSKNEITLIAKITNKELELTVDSSDLPTWFLNYVLVYYT